LVSVATVITGQRRGEMNLDPAMKDALEYAKEKQDVITLAKGCRGGLIITEIVPLDNGFMVVLRAVTDLDAPPHRFVFTRPDKIGTLVHTLYNSDLSNPKAIARLRRLMGYL
jgi:hypothetical protein